ncbi:ATP-binding cassette domain-containing protein [Paenibacillus anaericanus]|uniref:ATP-binding cassette domain-containing protein n=1 Tax=Paenibacillus anaericanus TaxID=170367 RepID=A0A3S1DSG9_9BACL|nr:ATP-binding cassette domain-containing protein [Paenibacillus anaericanus]RUT48074.1 ATP-binding cassette domain-containing protein [Paenibacillus anaericanus]
MIKVNNLNKSLTDEGTKREILHGITTQFEAGEMIGIVGPSGSGKSTLLRCLALREKWDSGNYTWEGNSVIKGGGRGPQKYRSKCAYLEQNPSLDIEKTALKNVLIGQAGQVSRLRRLVGMVRSDDYMGAMDELEKYGLLDKAKLKAGSLSGGEKQRVAICRALVHGAGFIAADEPVIGLDPKTAEHVINTLKTLCIEQDKIVIAALPIELAERYCTRIWGLIDGELRVDVKGRRLTMDEKRSIDLV